MSLRDDYVQALEGENHELRERIAALEGQLGIGLEAPLALDLSSQEARLFALFLRRPLVTKALAMHALYSHRGIGEEAEPKIIDVFVCKMRRKLKPFGIGIETQWGQGYFMTAQSKSACAALMEAA